VVDADVGRREFWGCGGLGDVFKREVQLGPGQLRRGIYQLLALEVGFVSPAASAEVCALLRQYLSDGCQGISSD
ncbi:hypothetical protein WCE15_26015, partial [Stutzerimonas stutzeri]